MENHKTGRPVKPEAEARSGRIAFRVTFDEQQRIEAAALASGVSVSDYARTVILTTRAPRPRSQRRAVNAAAISELNRVGVNLHQLVKHLNFGTGNVPHDLDALLEDIRAAMDKLTADDG
jgi:hypothetical protein